MKLYKKEFLWMIIAFGFMLFIYAPLELFCTNHDEFFYDIYILFPTLCLEFVIFIIIANIYNYFVKNHNLFYISYTICFVCFICSYIQGNYLSEWLPVINGQYLNWNDYPLERLKCIVLWGVGIIIAVVLYKKRAFKWMSRTCVFISLVLLLTLITLIFSTDSLKKKDILSTATSKNLLTVSKNENFIILLLDAADATAMNELLNESNTYDAVFEDFTYYTNAMGGYPYTNHSIPLILTGELFVKQEEFKEFAQKAYANSRLFNYLSDKEYKIGIYEPNFYIQSDQTDAFDNILDCERKINPFITFCRWQIQMTGYRYAPFDLKRFCYVYTDAFNNLKVLPDHEELYNYENWYFWNKLNAEKLKVIDDKCFRFVHLEGPHAPSRYDADMNITEESNYEESLKGSIKIVDTYLQELKSVGAYDNSNIIIMADHGGYDNSRDNPILFIKGKNEHHNMFEDDAPISYVDLIDAYIKLLDGYKGSDVFDYHEGDYRERYFYFQDDDDNPEEIMFEYVQKEHAGNMDALITIRQF